MKKLNMIKETFINMLVKSMLLPGHPFYLRNLDIKYLLNLQGPNDDEWQEVVWSAFSRAQSIYISEHILRY